MITKITSNEYLKRIDNMSATEREEYLGRVGEWLEKQAPLLLARANDSVARFQNAIQCSAMWNDDECRAWEDGARLLTAMAGKTDTWLPEMLYVKATKRAINQMTECLGRAAETGMPAVAQQDTQPSGVKTGDPFREKAGDGNIAGGNNKGEGKEAAKRNNGISLPRDINKEEAAINPVPVRPKHIDQYVHLLPEKTQQKAATVQGLLRDLDKARENARLLINDPKAKSDSIAQWAKAATALDAKVNAIYKELDAEWEKLVQSGRVTVDDFGNARVVTDAEATGMVAAEQNNDMTESRNNGEEEAAKEKRIEYLKKWLRDSRTKASDERKKQWEENYKELLSLGGEPTDSIRKAGEYYGVNLDDITK